MKIDLRKVYICYPSKVGGLPRNHYNSPMLCKMVGMFPGDGVLKPRYYKDITTGQKYVNSPGKMLSWDLCPFLEIDDNETMLASEVFKRDFMTSKDLISLFTKMFPEATPYKKLLYKNTYDRNIAMLSKKQEELYAEIEKRNMPLGVTKISNRDLHKNTAVPDFKNDGEKIEINFPNSKPPAV